MMFLAILVLFSTRLLLFECCEYQRITEQFVEYFRETELNDGMVVFITNNEEECVLNTNLENILRISYTSQTKPNSTKPNQTNTNTSLVQTMPDKILKKFKEKGK
ncbi:uncharacterized protein LOC111703909 [Eurytemora carolleeae]|uniref:uncharacterized protein LOC111703909 n=1 Tax=Eurytemora carolleeae TaxID=1294199 RepID=UPI000C781783|nr:uncharacterized protein LOC111703909 [Eurytemora carolleeae]|eukprot:XP_023331765.1 uncharacterized protein LOC111703909 [Eurytemora affinis]